MPCAQACCRALFTAAVILRRLRSPPAAIYFSARHAVGTDATGPNSSRWSPITRKSLITLAPSAIAHARSADVHHARGRRASRRADRRGAPRSWQKISEAAKALSDGLHLCNRSKQGSSDLGAKRGANRDRNQAV